MPTKPVQPADIKVGDRITMTTTRVETRIGVVIDLKDEYSGDFQLREDNQIAGLRWDFVPIEMNDKQVTTRTFERVEDDWIEGDVAYNKDGKIRFLRLDPKRGGLRWVDADGSYQALVGGEMDLNYKAVIRGGKPVVR